MRRQLCNDHVVPAEHVPKLAKILIKGLHVMKHEDALQCAWALTNLSCGGSAQTQAIVKFGGIGILGRIFRTTTHTELRDQCMWALANIACENIDVCQRIRKLNLFPTLISMMTCNQTSLRTMKNALWFLNRLVYNWNTPDYAILEKNLPKLVQAIIDTVMRNFEGKHRKDADCIWRDGLTTLSELIERNEGFLPGLILTYRSFAQYLMEACVKTGSKAFLSGSMRVFGTISNISDQHTMELIDLGIIDCLFELLEKSPNPQAPHLADVYWVLGNITGSDGRVSDILFAHEKFQIFHDSVVLALRNDKDDAMFVDACFIMLNSFASASPERIETLCRSGFFGVFQYVVKKRVMCDYIWDALAEAITAGSREEIFVTCGLIYDFDKLLHEAMTQLVGMDLEFMMFAAEYASFFRDKRREKDNVWNELIKQKPQRLHLDRSKIRGIVPDYDQMEVEIIDEEGNIVSTF